VTKSRITIVCEKYMPPCVFVYNITMEWLNFITVPRILLFMDMEFPRNKGTQVEKSWKFQWMGEGVSTIKPPGTENPGGGGGNS